MEQKAFSFDKTTLKKIGKSFLLVLAGTFLTFLTDNLVEVLAAFHLSAEMQVYLVGIFTFTINTVREYIKGVNNDAQ